MSFCPTDDLHSIYLDNEMPEAHKAEYESHIKVCPECQRKLENIRKLHELFESDSKSIEMDDARLEKSYEKLMSRMAYTKNVHNAERKTHSSWKYICSAAAAAMVFALIIPLRLNSKGSAVEAGSTTVANINASSMQPVTNVSVGGGNGVIVSGNIQSSVMQVSNGTNNLAQNINTKTNEGLFLTDVDVFRPAFEGDNSLTIKITIPAMNSAFVPSTHYLPENEAGQTE